MMIKWLIAIFLMVIVFGRFQRGLEKIGLGRLPGDFRFKWRGFRIFLPLTSGVLIGLVAVLISRLI
jgi:hypothetical protein